MKGGTPQGSESLCRTCTCGHIIKGFRASEEEVYRRYFYLEREIHFPVSQCTFYEDRRLANRRRWKTSPGFSVPTCPGAASASSARDGFGKSKPKPPFFPQLQTNRSCESRQRLHPSSRQGCNLSGRPRGSQSLLVWTDSSGSSVLGQIATMAIAAGVRIHHDTGEGMNNHTVAAKPAYQCPYRHEKSYDATTIQQMAS